ncbi:hypothetical protein Poly41_24500 [Novipirellula artificiosorum]|uniref:Uncharacterized protein n=1 Tax=Novipirellula artificiosorum TaxID=2528016 RepID=A0A5C6DTG1_9BACT|nr:hypothetical protein Poly41_24500 [Novipirellula artificiosorum]
MVTSPLGEVEPKRGRGKTGCDDNLKFQHGFCTGPPPRCARPLPLRGSLYRASRVVSNTSAG